RASRRAPPPPPARPLRGGRFPRRSESRRYGTQSPVTPRPGMGTGRGESEGGVAPFAPTVARPCPAATACEIVLTTDPSRNHIRDAVPAHYSRAWAPGRGSPRGRGLPCSPRRKSTSNLFENREDE